MLLQPHANGLVCQRQHRQQHRCAVAASSSTLSCATQPHQKHRQQCCGCRSASLTPSTGSTIGSNGLFVARTGSSKQQRHHHHQTACRATEGPTGPSAAAASAAAADVDAIVGDLPIRAVIHEVLHGLDNSNCLVLQAPPGAGKTTTVPLALLAHHPHYLQQEHNTILVLEPRRVAAKSAARRMSALLGEAVGRTVGYRVKLDTRVSSSTRIEVVTEGILLRRLQQDPSLEGVGVLVLDEFHERSLDADTALALALDCQAWTRPDLRLVVMSATLGGGLAEDLQALMTTANQQEASQPAVGSSSGSNGDGSTSSSTSSTLVPVVKSEGRSYPVKTHYLGKPLLQRRGELEAATVDAVRKALSASSSTSAAADGGGGGDVLVFLPGVAEIKRTQRLLQQEGFIRSAGVLVQQLHGSMAPQQQDEVIRPRSSRSGGQQQQQRRVVLATPITESSITIDGVTAVVDSGLHRAPRYDQATGISRLVTQRIALDSAEQRRGRAGRTRPGVCYRLWGQEDESDMLDSTPPEIVSADLAPLALQLAAWGCPDGQGLAWLDAPEPSALQQSRDLLLDLCAVDDKGALTDTGRRMCAVPAHPRLSHMVLRAQQLGVAELGCLLAALLSERDLLRGNSSSGSSSSSADLAVRLRVLLGQEPPPPGFDSAGSSRVLLSGQQMVQQLAAAPAATAISSSGSIDAPDAAAAGGGGDSVVNTQDELDEAESSMEDDEEEGDSLDTSSSSSAPTSSSSQQQQQQQQRHAVSSTAFAAVCVEQLVSGLLGALVAAAYPDRIAQLKPGSGGKATYSLSSGRSVSLPSPADPLCSQQYVAVAELQAGRGGSNDRIVLGAGLPPGAINKYLSDEVSERTVVFWAAASKAVLAKRLRVLGSLVLAEQTVKVDDEAALPVLIKGLSGGGWSSLPIPAAAEAWRQRAAWLHQAEVAAGSASGSSSSSSSSLPDLSTQHLLATLDKWLAPHLAGVRTASQLQKLPWKDILKGQMDWSQQQRVEDDAPSHLQLPTGSTTPIDYSSGTQPRARVKLQEVFGLADTPLLGGRGVGVPLLLELLSPAGRPLQVTANLATFWSEAYGQVKKEMKGRYPRHPWPDDPANAVPTRLTNKQLAAAAAGGGGSGGNAAGAAAAAGGKSGSSGGGGGSEQKPAKLQTVNKKKKKR